MCSIHIIPKRKQLFMVYFIHFVLSQLLCWCSYFVCTCKNPVHSVLFLILVFCNAAGILFLFNAEFLGLIFIIIYVGAIAVLFLFVIMMLRIKNKEENNSNMNWSIWIILFTTIEYVLLQTLGESFDLFQIDSVEWIEKSVKKDFDFSEILLDWSSDKFLLLDNANNIDVLGQVLFDYYLICFLLAGILLLIALVGCIVLTLKFNNVEESQNVNRQLSRSDNFLSFFK